MGSSRVIDLLTGSQQFVDGLADVWGAHQCFSDQHGAGSACSQAIDVGFGADAAFADQQGRWGKLRCESDRVVQICDKCSQVAVVDADEGGFQLQYSVQVFGIVDLDQRLHAEFAGVEIQVAQVAIGWHLLVSMLKDSPASHSQVYP